MNSHRPATLSAVRFDRRSCRRLKKSQTLRNAVFPEFFGPLPGWRGTLIPKSSHSLNQSNYHGRQVTKITEEGQETEAVQNERFRPKKGPLDRQQTRGSFRDEGEVDLWDQLGGSVFTLYSK